ncbi:MAG TPA: Gfo/Idh/MocA family oxidoreductase [Gammaproteobacteria bacterium]|nr:Gfo/Idh/MocA family oxidoreductase [Gammaproteobacteria bacterium]
MMPIRTAVIGVGYLGKYHAEKYARLEKSRLVAVVDTDARIAADVAARHGTRALTDYRELLGQVDAVSIVVPTSMHHAVAREFLQHGVHVLVEKPITQTVEEADELIALARKHRLVLQVGHLERFNAALLALDEIIREPRFIESHRLSPFKTRATDVNVILDLMIHDIDIILNLVKSELQDIDASGARVLSSTIDIANARLRFANGCIANVTASRISLKAERKMRIFQSNCYISVDFQNRILSRHAKGDGESAPGIPNIESRETIYENDDALQSEIAAFLAAIENNTPPLVSGEDGRRALQTATEITRLLKEQMLDV